ncbi:MAG: coproporphyrinogen-III oxidase family protein [Dehalococcoidia bacterium]
MISETATRILRRYLLGSDSQFVFQAIDAVELPAIDKTGLYIHIPFCKNTCPYCPYNKIAYDSGLVEPYLEAMLIEIERYHAHLGGIEISSIYIGGGTPTNLIDELEVILKRIKERFVVTGDICIETNPSDTSEETVRKLVDYGVGLVSLGVQSFDDRYLQLIGRNYTADILHPTIASLLSYGFKSVNLDLMFALPGQSVEEVVSDLRKAITSGVNQVTLYPLFTFPYSAAGRYLKLKRVKMPNIFTRRRMYRAIHDFCLENGFQRVSVWGFKRGDAPIYSSVTRDNYVGLGAGAGSYIPGAFYFNTFSVEEYIKTCLNDRLPVAFKMDFNESMAQYYWLYWRIYDTYIPKKRLFEIFVDKDKGIRPLLWLAGLFGLHEEDTEQIYLTERGAFWLHLMQNYFALNYIDKMWSIAMKEAWPQEIEI